MVEMLRPGGQVGIFWTRFVKPREHKQHLLTQVTQENLHGEIDTGPAAGLEAR